MPYICLVAILTRHDLNLLFSFFCGYLIIKCAPCINWKHLFSRRVLLFRTGNFIKSVEQPTAQTTIQFVCIYCYKVVLKSLNGIGYYLHHTSPFLTLWLFLHIIPWPCDVLRWGQGIMVRKGDYLDFPNAPWSHSQYSDVDEGFFFFMCEANSGFSYSTFVNL